MAGFRSETATNHGAESVISSTQDETNVASQNATENVTTSGSVAQFSRAPGLPEACQPTGLGARGNLSTAGQGDRTAEDDARALLWSMGVAPVGCRCDDYAYGADARTFTNGDLLILANLIAFASGLVKRVGELKFPCDHVEEPPYLYTCWEKLKGTLAAIRSLEVPE